MEWLLQFVPLFIIVAIVGLLVWKLFKPKQKRARKGSGTL